jgi:hypothetical protein
VQSQLRMVYSLDQVVAANLAKPAYMRLSVHSRTCLISKSRGCAGTVLEPSFLLCSNCRMSDANRAIRIDTKLRFPGHEAPRKTFGIHVVRESGTISFLLSVCVCLSVLAPSTQPTRQPQSLPRSTPSSSALRALRFSNPTWSIRSRINIQYIPFR